MLPVVRTFVSVPIVWWLLRRRAGNDARPA
jgi:hypothetical protein